MKVKKHKMKTKKIVTKRFRVSASGKLMHRVQGARHIRRRKDKSRQRRQDSMKMLDETMTRKLMPFIQN